MTWRLVKLKKKSQLFRYIDSVVEWLKPRNCHRHGLGSKPTGAILLCPWERHILREFSLPGGLGKQF